MMGRVTKKGEAKAAPKARRTGGRSARVRAAVLAATVEELKIAGHHGLSIAAVAARAGVAETSIYRRWKTVEGLVAEARFALFSENIAVPDRGSLRADLTAFLSATGRFLQTPLGWAVITSSIATPSSPSYLREVHGLWNKRFLELQPIFARAVERGDWPEARDAQVAIETLIGGIYFRALVMRQKVRRSDVSAFVDLVLGHAEPTDGQGRPR